MNMKRKIPNTEHRTPNIERRTGNHSLDWRWPRKGGHRSRVSWESGRETVRAGVRRYAPNRFNAQRRTQGYDARDSYEDKKKNTEHRTSNAEWKGPLFRVNETDSEYAAPKTIKYDLEDRLLEFAVAVVELTDDLPNTRAGNHIAGQLLRCGTSPYGHHGEVESAESRKDFIHRFSIVSIRPLN